MTTHDTKVPERFKAPMLFSTQKAAKMHPAPDGDYVRYSDYVALQARLDEVRMVKPLVWQGPFPANGYKKGRWNAAEFSVVRKGKDYWRVYRNLIDEKDAIYPTPEDAKAAAQADYERRILSVLSDQPEG